MIHVITPFHRLKNLPQLKKHYRTLPVRWWKITDVPLTEPNTIYYKPKGQEKAYEKINYFIRNIKINHTDYYCFMNDDDFYEEGFFKELSLTTPIVFVSMKRGDHNIEDDYSNHGTSTLFASEVRKGNVGYQQFIVMGWILKLMEFKEDSKEADGIMAEELKESPSYTILNNKFVLFNYLQEGRWDEHSTSNRGDKK